MTFVTFLKTSKIVSFPSVWNDFDYFYSHTLSSKSTFYLRLVTSFSSHLATANANVTAPFNTPKAPLWNCKSQCNYDANVSLSRNPAPVQRNASPFLHDTPLLCKSQWNSGASWHVTHPWKVTCQSSPQQQGHRSWIRTPANGCGRLRTRKQRRANTALPSDFQVKREPFATHPGVSRRRQDLRLLLWGRSYVKRSPNAEWPRRKCFFFGNLLHFLMYVDGKLKELRRITAS